jgi:signal transduction histidine kinase
VVTAPPSPNLPPPWDGYIQADESFLQRTRALTAADPALGIAIRSRVRRSDFRGTLLQLQSRAAEGCGDLAAALSYSRQWSEHELRARSRCARKRAKAIERSRLAVRGEAMEFITHDLRSPLAAVIQQLDRLASEAPRETHTDDLRRAAASARRAMQIADQSLGIMRAELMAPAELAPLDLAC